MLSGNNIILSYLFSPAVSLSGADLFTPLPAIVFEKKFSSSGVDITIDCSECCDSAIAFSFHGIAEQKQKICTEKQHFLNCCITENLCSVILLKYVQIDTGFTGVFVIEIKIADASLLYDDGRPTFA